MIREKTVFNKGSDCLSIHQYLFERFLREADDKGIGLAEYVEIPFELSISITVKKLPKEERKK